MAMPDFENKAIDLLKEIRDQLALIRGELEQLNEYEGDDEDDEE